MLMMIYKGCGGIINKKYRICDDIMSGFVVIFDNCPLLWVPKLKCRYFSL